MADSMKLTVNRRPVEITGEPTRSLLEVLREDLQLTGTKYGCGEGACGACTVLVDGKRAFSCSTPLSEVIGKSILTIEGLQSRVVPTRSGPARAGSEGDTLHPVQEAFCAEGAMQCGYCTSGMIMAAVAMLHRNAHPGDGAIIDGMNPNLCRCCSYPKILLAVKRAATASEAAAPAAGGKS